MEARIDSLSANFWVFWQFGILAMEKRFDSCLHFYWYPGMEKRFFVIHVCIVLVFWQWNLNHNFTCWSDHVFDN
jgi:hypothetical protein